MGRSLSLYLSRLRAQDVVDLCHAGVRQDLFEVKQVSGAARAPTRRLELSLEALGEAHVAEVEREGQLAGELLGVGESSRELFWVSGGRHLGGF